MVACRPRCWGQTPYYVTDLGTVPGYNVFRGMAINANGQVAVEATLSNDSGDVDHAFLYSNGSLTDLGMAPGFFQSYATGVNSSGQVVGEVINPNLGVTQHVRGFSLQQWDDGLPGHARGQLGVMRPASTTAARWSAGPTRVYPARLSLQQWNDDRLGRLSRRIVLERGIGHQRQRAGGGVFHREQRLRVRLPLQQRHDDRPRHASRRRDSCRSAINAGGQVAGFAITSSGANHAFLYSNGTMQDLGTLPGFDGSDAMGINASGEVVGWNYVEATDVDHAFLYSKGAMVDLNTLISPAAGWTLAYASAINDSGQIVGWGSDSGTDAPTPAPFC